MIMNKQPTMLTFKEWSTAGYIIKKGSKGTRVAGEVLFSQDQVFYGGDDEHDEHDAFELWVQDEYMWGDR